MQSIWPESVTRSTTYRLIINGSETDVLSTPVADFAYLPVGTTLKVELVCDTMAGQPSISPWALNIKGVINGKTLTFEINEATNLCIEITSLPVLFLYPSHEIEYPKEAEGLHFFESGKVHEVGMLEVGSNETVFVEKGAVLRALIRCRDAESVTITGGGIIDGSFYEGSTYGVHFVRFENCKQSRINNVTLINSPKWVLVIAACEDMAIENVSQIGEAVSTDGIDVVGSKNVSIRDCSLRNNDDCIVIKAFDSVSSIARHYQGEVPESVRMNHSFAHDVKNILVERCLIWNANAGNALEIGFELQTNEVSDILFRDCDIVGSHGEGGVFTIHVGDQAHVHHVYYEDIRVQHFYDKFIDFRVLDSVYSVSKVRGHITDIILRNVHAVPNKYNATSLLGGGSDQHRIQNITIENLYFGKEKILSPSQMHLFSLHADDVEFR